MSNCFPISKCKVTQIIQHTTYGSSCLNFCLKHRKYHKIRDQHWDKGASSSMEPHVNHQQTDLGLIIFICKMTRRDSYMFIQMLYQQSPLVFPKRNLAYNPNIESLKQSTLVKGRRQSAPSVLCENTPELQERAEKIAAQMTIWVFSRKNLSGLVSKDDITAGLLSWASTLPCGENNTILVLNLKLEWEIWS